MHFFAKGALTSLALLLCGLVGQGRAVAAEPIVLTVDATKVPTQNLLFVTERIPVTAGAMTLFYPQWIPGEHGPVGPIANLAGLKFSADGTSIPWLRDTTDMFAFHITVPSGVTHVDASYTYLGAPFGNYSSNRLGSSNMAAIVWNQVLLYPSTGTIQDTFVKPTLILPGSDWKFATALTGAQQAGTSVTFNETSVERLLDSTLDMGENYRRWKIWQDGDAAAYLNLFADTPSELDVSDAVVDHYKKLVDEMIAMYGARHWRNYNFLLTDSDVIPGEGIEHHESSDDGGSGDYLINPASLDQNGDLLSHEFNHSWDGKYRMPAGLYPSNLNTAYDDSLLWVYEGMTQYYGNVMSWRDGIREQKSYPDHIAAVYAYYDNEPGRDWRPIDDTAASAPFLYGAPRMYTSERRSVDFYSESELMWLKADSIIRAGTGGKKSLDTFARAFFGGETTGPIVKTYDRADVIAGINAVYPYDWTAFFHTWVDDIALHPPDGFTADGWKLVYTDQPQHWVKKNNFWYSIGLTMRDGAVYDVKFGSPAYNAGIGINTKIVAVNGREYSDDLLYQALVDAKTSKRPIELLVSHTAMYRTVSVSYDGGPLYPHLVRIDGTTDRLSDVSKSLTGK